MGLVKFDIYAWRDIHRVCGTVTASCAIDRIICKYMDLHFTPVECTAYGSNGAQISKVIVRCEAKDIPFNYHLLIPPMRTPAHTRSVEIHIDDEEKEYTVIFIDAEDEIIYSQSFPFFDGEPLDYESFYKKTQDKFDSYSRDGQGKYFIAFNPKYLIAALEGMKNCEHVYLHFGSQVDPCMIRSDGEELVATALVYPVRVM